MRGHVKVASSPNGYQLAINNTGTANQWAIYRLSNGTQTTLGATFSQALAVGDSVGLRASGNTLTA